MPQVKSRKLKKPIKPKHQGCLNCPAPQKALALNDRIAVGFGDARLTRDGETVFREAYGMDYDDCWTVRKAENRAAKEPKRDWRIVLHGPMHGETYQRQGLKLWVCIESNGGFA